MLRIYTDIIQFNRQLQPIVKAVARQDSGLADQLRRAARSIALNTAEAHGHVGRRTSRGMLRSPPGT